MHSRFFFPMTRLLVFGLVCFLAAITAAAQSERILDFRSRIAVQRDGSVTVSEDIRVVSSGDQIKRGIYRDFPTRYQDRYGNSVRVAFEVLEVLRDGRPEPYHIKDISNGIRIYVGQKEVLLRPGTYTYTIVYVTRRQLGFFRDFDELYWNVTGHGWNFVIEHAEAMVELPSGAEILKTAGYTGRYGSRGQDYRTGTDEYGNLLFVTTRPLMPKEGLTIAVAWPKGIVAEPTSRERLGDMLKDNRSVTLAVIGLITLLGFYLVAWVRVGRDPAEGTIIPLFAPPQRISPALARVIMRLGRRDDKVFAVAVVNMAVKGFLTIEEDGDKVFTLKKTGAGEEYLSGGEAKIARKLFGGGSTLRLKKENHKKIGSAKQELLKYLMKEARNKYFVLNSGYFLTGLIITGLTLASVVLGSRQIFTAIFMGVWLSGWTAACFFLGLTVIRAWRGMMISGLSGVLQKTGAVGITLFALPFFGFEGFGLWAFSSAVSPLAAATLVVIIGINVIFYHLLKAPTLTGRKLMDTIDGFKLYLSVAEKDRLNLLHPPAKTPELFEKYLPYALALDVEQKWSEQFAGVLAAASGGQGYQPAWYSGDAWRSVGMHGIANRLGTSLPGAISSASAAPGSSSGSGGGGFSGGGGGSSGGGGW